MRSAGARFTALALVVALGSSLLPASAAASSGVLVEPFDVLLVPAQSSSSQAVSWPSRRRRSWTRTLAGGVLVASAFLVPLGREFCVLLPDFSGGSEQACTLRLHPGRVAGALALAGAGVALSTVFSSVRPSRTRVAVMPRRLTVTYTLPF